MDELLKKMLADQESNLACERELRMMLGLELKLPMEDIMEFTDEQVQEINFMLHTESERQRELFLDDELVCTIEQLMREEEEAYLASMKPVQGATFQAPVDTIEELYWRGAEVGDIVYVQDEGTSFILTDPGKWTPFSKSEPVDALKLIDIKMLTEHLEAMCSMVTWNYAIPKPEAAPAQTEFKGFGHNFGWVDSGRKVLSSRTESHEHLVEVRAENDRRRRNAGKRILSSRD